MPAGLALRAAATSQGRSNFALRTALCVARDERWYI